MLIVATTFMVMMMMVSVASSSCEYSNQDPETNCTTCLGNWDILTHCTTCRGNYNINSGCIYCIKNFDIEYGCDSCIDGCHGETCDDCVIKVKQEINYEAIIIAFSVLGGVVFLQCSLGLCIICLVASYFFCCDERMSIFKNC
jgi:hypothetical protein